jgi:translation initiation factor 1
MKWLCSLFEAVMKPADPSTLVYSSETGLVKQERTATRSKTRPQAVQAPPADGTVRLRRETKGRGGGTVIVISGIPLAGPALKELAGALKKRCGCGGTIKDGIIEIQGDHRDTLLLELQTRGYRVKLAGG